MTRANIEELIREGITPSLLAEKYGFKSFKSGNVTRINSAPRKVEFCNAEFVASFIFINDVIKRIILVPVIKNVDVPNYPSEEYQETKRKYCTDVLYKAFGKPDYNDKLQDDWERPEYKISCCSILEGKDIYSGGNMAIEMR